MAKKAKISIDETCIGCGTCSAMCPKYYVMNGPKAEPVQEVVDEEGDIPDVKDAEAACPVSAIHVEDLDA